jgi:hypothetical protein
MKQLRAVLAAARIYKLLAIGSVCAGLLSVPARADFITTTVTGTVQFGTRAILSLGTTNIGSGVEFTYSDSLNTDTIDFSSTSFTLTDVSTSSWMGSGSEKATYTFTDLAFLGMGWTIPSDSFGGATINLVGDVLTVTTPAFSTAGTYKAVFLDGPVSAVPEPATPFMLCVFAAACWVARRKLAV